MPRLTVEGVGTFTVPAGKRLVNALADECGLDQLHACGGNAKCGTCRVAFLAGEPADMRPAEREALVAMGLRRQQGIRLSCQVTCDTDMSVRAFSLLAGSGRDDVGPRPSELIEGDVSSGPAREQLPEVETFRIVKWLRSPAERLGGRSPAVDVEEPLFRPVLRPAVPVLTVLDDGSMDVGEEIRIRKNSFVIGRSGGDLALPNDATISKEHAEIRLVANRGVMHWMLHDLGSINGTFVRVNRTSVFVDTIIVIGSRRYRLEGPFQRQTGDLDRADGNETLLVGRGAEGGGWPSLVDSSGRPDSKRFLIRKPKVTIGGMHGGCDIEIDDPLVARHHATLERDSNGVWHVLSVKPRNGNGIWTNIHAVGLTPYCYFQCGEQRFRFVIP